MLKTSNDCCIQKRLIIEILLCKSNYILLCRFHFQLAHILPQFQTCVNFLFQLTTPQGRGRGLLRLCLSEGNLAECIQTAVNNEKITK